MILTKEDIQKYALAHGKVFEFMCDEKGCGKLIAQGEQCYVLKWVRRTDGLTFLGATATTVRCLGCEEYMHPKKQEDVKVANSGRGAKKVSKEVASKLAINPIVRRAVLALLKLNALATADLLNKLRKKKAIREINKSEVNATLRALKKLKVIKAKAKVWSLPVQKPVKKAKKKQIKVLAKR